MKTFEEIEKRFAEIESEMDVEGADLDALTEEVKTLKEERKQLEDNEQKRANLLDDIATGKVGKEIPKAEERKVMENKVEVLNPMDLALRSAEYESAFTKRFTQVNPQYTEAEQRALNTTNGAALIPHRWLTTIYDEMKETHPILQDLTWNNIDAIVEIPKRLAITSGDAAVMEEGTCPVGEENEFESITVDLIEIQKMIEITAKMSMLLPEAFKNWLINEVRDRIGHQLAVQVVAKLKEQVAAQNKLTAATPGTLEVADVLGLLATEGTGVAKIYANRKTVFANIAQLKLNESTAFLPNLQDSLSGNLIGTEVRMESAMADGELLLVFPQDVFLNVPGGIRMRQEEDACFKIKISGITFMGLVLTYTNGAALLTVGTGV